MDYTQESYNASIESGKCGGPHPELTRALREGLGEILKSAFGKKKKPETEEPQDEFFIRPYGGPVHQPNRYPGLIWSILGEINCDYGGRITKEQALAYIKRLIPAIKDNPDMPTFEKTLYRVVEAIG